MVDIGNRIKALRVSQKITQNEFATRLGVTKSAISSYENGSRLPSYDILIKISRIFKVSTDYLLGCVDEKAQSVSVSGLTESQIAAVKSSIRTFRAFNVLQKQIPQEMQPFLEEFVEDGTWNGEAVTLDQQNNSHAKE